MKTYAIWNHNRTSRFGTYEEALEEAKKRAKRNRFGCDIYLCESSGDGIETMTHVKTVTRETK